MTPRSLPSLAALVLLAGATTAQGNDPECDPVTLQWTQPSYSLGESVSLNVSGTPGTFGVLYASPNPGPLVVPGIGTFDVGAGPGLKTFIIKPLPESGERFFNCLLLCQQEEFKNLTLFVQALTISPLAPETPCISNMDPLVIDDGECLMDGCTPGIWKNKTALWSDTGYAPGDDFDTVFGVDLFDPDITLLQAVEMVGGTVDVFSAHATAALLNATHPDVDYALTEGQVIQMVQDAVLSGNLEPLKDKLDMLNNSGCPL